MVRNIAAASCAVLISLTAWAAEPQPNQAAPNFEGLSTDGSRIKLDQFKGQKVVLEWTNDGCPYVQKHYATNNMQLLQKKMAAEGVEWISIISSAPGKQGHVSAAEADALTADRDAAPSHVILDPSGDIGRLYDAKTTPHMFLIDEEGVVQYMGAIDDKPTARHRSVNGAENYVLAAYEAVKGGQTPDPQATKPYGCSIKY